MRLTSIWLLVQLFACTGQDPSDEQPARPTPATWDELVDVCDLYYVSPTSAAVTARGYGRPVDEPCAEAVATAVGLDWDSFSDRPHDYPGPGSTTELVISGIITLVSPSGLTSGELVSDDGPTTFMDDLVGQDQDSGDREDEDAGRLLYAFITRHISQVLLDPGLSEDGLTASYHEGTVSVAAWTGEVVADDDFLTLWEAAVAMLHEASHGLHGYEHVACSPNATTRGCDLTRNGAYGVGEWWRYQWFVGSDVDLDPWGCWRLMDVLASGCVSILDDSSYVACSAAAWTGCGE